MSAIAVEMDGAANPPGLQEEMIVGVIIASIGGADLDGQFLSQIGLDQRGQEMAIIPLTWRNDDTRNHLGLRVVAGMRFVPIEVLRHSPLVSVFVPYRAGVFHSPPSARIPSRLPPSLSAIVLLHIHIGHAMGTVDDLQRAKLHPAL